MFKKASSRCGFLAIMETSEAVGMWEKKESHEIARKKIKITSN